MELSKKQKFLISVISNVVIVVILSVCALSLFFVPNRKIIQTTNSEYNGTIYAGDKTSNNISLMVNVYWGNEYLEKMLEIFEKYEVKTTFFVGGTWVQENGDLLKKMHTLGHEIASHGYSHKQHGKISLEENLSEISKCHDLVKHNLKIDMGLFAPPGGSYSKNTTKAAESLGYKTIMWTRDTIDWRDQNADLIFTRAISNISGGDLVLMHPTKATAEALEQIILAVKQKGYNIVTVSETLAL